MKIDLIEKTEVTEEMGNFFLGLKKSTSCGKFNRNDTISFWGGMNNDLRFTSRIMGIDDEDGIYVIWDCFWYPIKNVPEREIVHVEY
jgi:hypothetical protein